MTTKATGTRTSTKKVVKPTAKQAAKKKLERTNKKVITQKVIIHRVLKYQYPRNCKETVARKAFRQIVRNKIRKLEREIAELRGEDRRIMKETLATYMQEFLI